MIYSVAVTSKIDKALAYTDDDIPQCDALIAASLRVGALVRVPLGKRTEVGMILSVEKSVPQELENIKLRSIQYALPKEYWLTQKLVDTLHWTAKYYQGSFSKVLNTVLPSVLVRSSANSFQPDTGWQANPQDKNTDISEVLSRSPRQLALYRWLKQNPNLGTKDIGEAGFDANLLKKLAEKKLVIEVKIKQKATTPEPKPRLIDSPKTLTPEQSATLDQFRSSAKPKSFLLEGVTGSGKTEVYLQMAEPWLLGAKQVLVLIPEIGLVHQMKTAFRERFNSNVYIYTSECNDTEKKTAWHSAASGNTGVFIGTRSAIFLPMTNPGLIVIDEEHDLSYKQQEGLRYNARDLATIRARELDVPLVLGSATPSLESLSNVESGKYQHLQLPKRVYDVALPKITLNQSVQNQILSNESIARICEELRSNNQVLIFVNRRGYAPRTKCLNCGWLALCPNCDSALCRHIHPAALICHHCDFRQQVPHDCPHCQSRQLTNQGSGTEQIESHLNALFPETACIRIDRDSTSRKGAFQQHLERANSQEACILVGTQMLAKGHHLPRLSLAVVCDADQALFSHDFRAKEQLAQLVTQVAGRTGRVSTGGELVIESNYVDHPFWTSLTEGSYSAFAAELATERRRQRLPPYAYAASLRAECVDFQTLAHFMDAARFTSNAFSDHVDIVGPIPAVLERKKNRHRYQLNFTSTARKHLHQMLSTLSHSLKNQKQQSQVRWVIDVDPQTLD